MRVLFLYIIPLKMLEYEYFIIRIFIIYFNKKTNKICNIGIFINNKM